MSQSRTAQTLKNANVSLLFSIIGVFAGFFTRKIFIDYLSAEVLGLNTVASDLLGFLNIAELGIGVAISYTLYKPLFNNDRQTMIDIITVQGYIYRRIAYIILAGSGVLMCFFPLIFAKTDLPLWYAYATFSVLLCGSLFGYIWNYKQILLSADQKQYKVTINQQLLKYLKLALQMGAIYFFPQVGYLCWIALEFIFAIVQAVALNRVINKEYPWLETELSRGKELMKRYPEIITKTKQVFFHKIGRIALFQASPMVMYAYTSLTIVALYGNYMVLTAGLSMLFNSLFNSMGAGIGSLVAQGDKERINEVFWELFTIRFWITLGISIPLFYLSSPFVTLWLGAEYLLEDRTIFMIVLIFFIGSTRSVVEGFIGAYGLYHDTWAPLTEAVINLTLAITLGYFFGITGVLSGIAISLITIVLIWKPYFLFTQGFERSVWPYCVAYIKHLAIVAVTLFSCNWFFHQLPWSPAESIPNFLLTGATLTLSSFLISGTLFYLCTPGLPLFLKRILMIAKGITRR